MKRTLLLTLPALLLAGCAAASEPTQTDALAIENRYPLDYAQQFTVDECAGGYSLITIDGSRYLVVPEGAAVPAELDDDIVVLQQPIENIYLVSSSAMDPIISIGGLGAVALSGTQAENCISTLPAPPWNRGKLSTRASTAPRITRRFWPLTAALPSKTR